MHVLKPVKNQVYRVRDRGKSLNQQVAETITIFLEVQFEPLLDALNHLPEILKKQRIPKFSVVGENARVKDVI